MAVEAAQNGMILMGHACLWGSLAVAAVGVCCRCLPRLPAAVRAWLWWLASAKLLLGLCLAAPILLPILPAPPSVVRTASAPAALTQPSATRFLRPHSVSTAALPALPLEADAPPTPAPTPPRWPALLLGAWALGVAASLGLTLRQSLALRRLRRGAAPAALPPADLDALAGQMGLRRAPHVLTGPHIPTPCVTGVFRPVILLPVGFGDALTPAELRLILAHEMAHVKRGDLLLAWMPLLARTLFFFNPFAWWGAAEWAAAREEACDALALSATHLPPADYGRLLLKFASPATFPPALGLSPGFAGLRRRLVSLRHARPLPRRMRLLALALPLLLPWRLSAALPPATVRPAPAPGGYFVAALTENADGDGGEVSALNNAGQVALSVHSGGGAAQGYAGSAGVFAPLDALPKHRSSLVYGLSDTGQAAGASFNIPGHARAFVWDGVSHKLGSLPGYPYSEARGISDAGDVAGFAETGRADRRRAWVTRAFVRRPGAALIDLGTLGGSYSAAYAVSALGTVVGKADTDALGATHAFVWTESAGMTDLGTLGGANSVAYAVSDTGGIAGASETDDAGTRHAFLYANGAMHDLAPLPALTSSAAYAVNASGQVAGVSQAGGVKRATLWQNGQPTDLNAQLPPRSGWTLTEARAVNDHGQIAGLGLFHGHRRAFLLTPRLKKEL